MALITAPQLAAVAPHADPKIAAAVIAHADDVLPRYGLATRARLTDFLAHVLVESAYLTTCAENLNYSAARLMQVWPGRFPSLESTIGFAHNPEGLANRVYGARMGNTGPNDGWLNRGQGLIDTTGHDNIAKLAAHMGIAFEAARVMLTSDTGMLEAAAAVYCMLGAPAHADKGDIVGSTRCINGGANGLADRRTMLAKCQRVWSDVSTPDLLATIASHPITPTPVASHGTASVINRPKPTEATNVRSLQGALSDLGYYRGPVDADFGPFTEAAVSRFQRDHGLAMDGVVGPATYAAIDAAKVVMAAAPPAPSPGLGRIPEPPSLFPPGFIAPKAPPAPYQPPEMPGPHLVPAVSRPGFWARLKAAFGGKAA